MQQNKAVGAAPLNAVGLAMDLNRRRFLGLAAASVSAIYAGGRTVATSAKLPRGHILPAAHHLTCEYRTNPLGIDAAKPRLGWQLAPALHAVHQTAYQILVAGDLSKLESDVGDLWNSGKVDSEESVDVVYNGQPMRSSLRCYWKVRIWYSNNVRGEWSEPAVWEMGLLAPSDWHAVWIGSPEIESSDAFATAAAPYLRTVFRMDGPIKAARAYVCGLGYYELYLNGTKVGNQVLAPAQTDYGPRNLQHLLYPVRDNGLKRVLYNTYDITSHLRSGNNAVGVILGNGWYNQRARRVEGWMWYGQPRLMLQLRIEYADGTVMLMGTTPQWKVATGPILQDAIFTGETYDARREMPTWCQADFDDSAWSSARTFTAPGGPLQAQNCPFDRVVETLAVTALVRPVRGLEAQIFQPKPGLYGFDCGRNFAGWVRLKLRQPAGTKIKIQYIEDSGLRYGQSDTYIAKGRGEEVYEPRFTWHGFRYIEVSGCVNPPEAQAISGRCVHADVQSGGAFECSSPLLNQIYANYRRTQLAAMHGGVPMDCPHRERLGYGADGHLSAQSAIYSFDMHRFYIKWAQDLADAQGPRSGFIPHTAPFEGGGGGPAWGSAAVLIPWYVYLYYGDRRILETHYEVMRKWVAFLQSCTNHLGIITHEEPGGWCLGDWATPETIAVPPELVNTCYLAHLCNVMADIAGIMNRQADVARFKLGARRATGAVNAKFLNMARSGYSIERQGANVFPLAFGIVPSAVESKVFDQLVQHIEKTTHCHFDTGILATPLILDVLTRHGRADLAMAMMSQTTYPSYGWQIAIGATTLWEQWNGRGSHMHPMFGSVCAWFYRDLAGIKPVRRDPGFKTIDIAPHLVPGLTWVRAQYHCPFGNIRSDWRWQGGQLALDVTIPTGSTAVVTLPEVGDAKVRCNGRAVEASTEVIHVLKPARSDRGAKVLTVPAGHYRFDYNPQRVR